VAAEPVRLQMYNHSGDQASIDQWRQVVAPFTQRHPNVTIEIGGPPGGPNTLLDSALKMGAAGTPPDFTYSVTRNGPTLFTSGLTQDVAPVVKRERIDLKDVPKAMIENMEWQGKLMALPYDLGYSYVQYNKLLFDRAGIPDPGTLWRQKKWDWDAFVNSVAAFSRQPFADGGEAGFWIRTVEADYLSIIRSLGGDTLSKDRARFVLGESAGLAALAKWGELATRYRAAPPDKGPPGDFDGGKLAMMSSNPATITRTQRAAQAGGQPWRWDVVPHPAPAGKKPIPILFTNGLYLWKGTTNESTTVEVLKFMMQDERLLAYGKLTGRDPARTMLQAEHVKNLGIPQNDPKSWLDVYRELTPLVQGIPWTVSYVEWHAVLASEVLTPVGKGEKSPQEAVNAATPKISAILART
jgi:ABC-type glycerol-3-phosphate transport system substrate-binding protein